jgi:hypothetical protein
MTKAIEFYQANKAVLESADCMDAHEYLNSHCVDAKEYIIGCTNLLKACQLSRGALIAILSNNDRNGIYSDKRSIDEGYPIATKSDLLYSMAICEIEL